MNCKSCIHFPAQYFGATIVLVSVSCGLTVLVLCVHHQGADGTPVPGWMRHLVLVRLRNLLFMKPSHRSGDLHGEAKVLPKPVVFLIHIWRIL